MSSFKRIYIWDPVTRVWHWVLVMAVCIGWSLGKFMSMDSVLWHFYLGYLILGLVFFRLCWGVFGPGAARFRNMLYSPRSVVQYCSSMFKRSPSGTAGHNPLGSIWIMVFIGLLIVQGVTGLFSDADDFFEYGPLFDFVSEDTADFLNGWHYYGSNIILGMVVLHVAVVMFYLFWKKENLIGPMIHGWKSVKADAQEIIGHTKK